MPLKSFLTRLILICVLPLVILAAYLSFDRVRSLQAQRAQEADNLARSYAAALDRLLNARLSALRMLAASTALAEPHRMEAFYQEAQAFHKNFGNHVLLADLATHMILNTRAPLGTALPNLPQVKGHSSVATVLATGKPAVGDTFTGPIDKALLVSLAVPVTRNDRISYLLLSIMETRQFQERLDEFSLPAGFALSLLDGKGAVIARRLPPGGKAHPNLDDFSGRIVIKSSIAPWSVVLAVHRDNYRLPLYAASAALAAALLGATLISVLGGILAGRELAGSVASLAGPAASPGLHADIAEIETVRSLLAKATSARELAETTQQASEERYRSLVESAPIAIFINRGNRIEYANPPAIRLFGADDTGEVVGRSPYEFVHPEYHGVMTGRITTLLQGGSVPLLEMRILQVGGDERAVEVIAAAFADHQGTAIQVMMRDISERKQAEADKATLEAQLQQAQKMESVGRLAGGVAHDFNNMLSVILGYAQMGVNEVTPDQPLHGYFAEIRKAADRSADLTRQLLAFARKQTIAPAVLDLNKTVSGMLKMLQRLIGEDIHLSWEPREGVWPVKVDPSQIDQILANLCVNARDAISDVGKITIETGNCTFDREYCDTHFGFVPGEYVLLAVSDDGYGMDKPTQAHIFEPFFTTKSPGQGTGLGLATVYGIVRQNNGFINVYSEPGHGTTFKVYLPRYGGDSEEIRPEIPAAPLAGGQETILLVEDEAAILNVTRMMLEKQGYTVIAARTPGEAIRLAHEYDGTLNLLLTDVVMPDMNGRDLAQQLQSLQPQLKTLFMSGYTANVIAHHGVLDEGVQFIQKPFSAQDLAAKMRKALDLP